MTLNTHSLEEEDYEAKLHAFAEGVCRAEPDIIALQEPHLRVSENTNNLLHF